MHVAARMATYIYIYISCLQPKLTLKALDYMHQRLIRTTHHKPSLQLCSGKMRIEPSQPPAWWFRVALLYFQHVDTCCSRGSGMRAQHLSYNCMLRLLTIHALEHWCWSACGPQFRWFQQRRSIDQALRLQLQNSKTIAKANDAIRCLTDIRVNIHSLCKLMNFC
jgi:hypothetical protein